jgi:hypothetical protein
MPLDVKSPEAQEVLVESIKMMAEVTEALAQLRIQLSPILMMRLKILDETVNVMQSASHRDDSLTFNIALQMYNINVMHISAELEAEFACRVTVPLIGQRSGWIQ